MPGSSLSRYSPVPGASVAPCWVTRYCSGERPEMTAGSRSNLRTGCSSRDGAGRLTRCVLRENIVAVLHDGVTRQPALRVVGLRRLAIRVAGPESLRRGIVFEHGPAPAAAVGEALAVFDHEVDVFLGACHGGCAGCGQVLLRVPMDLGHPGAIGKRLAVGGNARLERLDHCGISQDYGHGRSILAHVDRLPALVTLELRESEPSGHLDGVFVRRGNGAGGCQRGKRCHDGDSDQILLTVHCRTPVLRGGCMTLATCSRGRAFSRTVRRYRSRSDDNA